MAYDTRLIEKPVQGKSEGDMMVELVGINGKELTVKAWIVTLEVREFPLALVYIDDQIVGNCSERLLDPYVMVLKPGQHTCLVLERVKQEGVKLQTICLLVLGFRGDVAERRAIAKFSCYNVNFYQFNPKQKLITLV